MRAGEMTVMYYMKSPMVVCMCKMRYNDAGGCRSVYTIGYTVE